MGQLMYKVRNNNGSLLSWWLIKSSPGHQRSLGSCSTSTTAWAAESRKVAMCGKSEYMIGLAGHMLRRPQELQAKKFHYKILPHFRTTDSEQNGPDSRSWSGVYIGWGEILPYYFNCRAQVNQAVDIRASMAVCWVGRPVLLPRRGTHIYLMDGPGLSFQPLAGTLPSGHFPYTRFCSPC